jgi:hypothetical protein
MRVAVEFSQWFLPAHVLKLWCGDPGARPGRQVAASTESTGRVRTAIEPGYQPIDTAENCRSEDGVGKVIHYSIFRHSRGAP